MEYLEADCYVRKFKFPITMQELVSTQAPTDDCSLIGNEPWTFVKITDILNSSGTSETLWNNLPELSRRLEIPAEIGCSMKRRLSTDTATNTEILYEILEAWRMKAARDASIFLLIRVLEKMGLKDSADALRNEMPQNQRNQSKLLLFKDDIIHSTTWDHLSESLKIEIGEKLIDYQSKKIKLNQLGQDVEKYLDGITLKSLSNEEVPVLVNNQVPDQLKYYINRRVRSRFLLKPNLLKANCHDVFVIEGIERHQLSSLVPNCNTDVSKNQIESLTVRFIQLECVADYKKICSLADEPVLWIKYNKEHFEFVKSSGSVKTLQEYIYEKPCSEGEMELSRKNAKVTVISDSRGMGKTNLVVNLAHEIMKQDNKILVRFIRLQEFLQKLPQRKITLNSILSLIAKQSSNWHVGQEFVLNILKAWPCVIIVDGFDEVLTHQFSAAKAVLQQLTTLDSVKLYVTTRPHMRNELENTLHVLGYSIQQFDESDQKNFLTSYWNSIGIPTNESVITFADQCISEISSKMTDFEKDIAGIPLQCRLLADIYVAYANRCSSSEFQSRQNLHPIKLVNSIFGMYERHIENTFEKSFSGKGKTSCLQKFLCKLTKKKRLKTIQRAHMYYALKCLFPEHVDTLPCFVRLSSSYLFKCLCGMGILEATDSENIRFVHRTFAEYFVAWFVVDAHDCPVTVDFILSQVFSTTVTMGYFQLLCLGGYSYESFKFNFPVICHFINGFANKRGTKPLQLRKEPSLNSLISKYTDQLIPIIFASAVTDCPYVPAVASEKLFAGADIHTIQYTYISTVILIMSKHSGIETLKIFCDDHDLVQLPFIEVKPPGMKPFKLTPVHVAVQRGDYNLVEYFIRKYDKKLLNLAYLLHICVHKSNNDDAEKIEEKKQIIKLLLKNSTEWLEERFYDVTPLMQFSPRINLLECLIEEGADVNVTDGGGKTLYEKLTDKQDLYRPGNPSVYDRLLYLIKQSSQVKSSLNDFKYDVT